MSSLPVWTDHIIISHKSLYQLYPAAEHLSPPSTTSRLSDSEVSEPDFEADSHGLNTKEKAKTRAWIRQEAASLSGKCCLMNFFANLKCVFYSGNSMGSSSSPPPRDRIRRDISPKSGEGGAGARPGHAETAQNRQIAYSGAMRAAPVRRRLPQVPMRGRGGRGMGQGPTQGRGQFLSMDRGHKRQVHGRPQPGYSGNSGYSDTEMLSEMGDSWAAERHRQRLDRLRLVRDHGDTMTPSTGAGPGTSAFLETQSLASEPQFSRGQFSDQHSYGGWSWRYGLNDGGWDKGGGGGYMSDVASVCGYTSDTGYRPSDRNYPPPPVHATNTSTGIR